MLSTTSWKANGNIAIQNECCFRWAVPLIYPLQQQQSAIRKWIYKDPFVCAADWCVNIKFDPVDPATHMNSTAKFEIYT